MPNHPHERGRIDYYWDKDSGHAVEYTTLFQYQDLAWYRAMPEKPEDEE